MLPRQHRRTESPITVTKPGAGAHRAAVTALLLLQLVEPARELPQPPGPGTPPDAGNPKRFAQQVFCEFPMGQEKNEGVGKD